MFIQIHPENPELRKINQVVDILKKGGVIIYPTDTIYGLGCDITNQKAVERICWLKGIKPKKARFSFICHDLSHISDYTKQFSSKVYKVMRRSLPGPFTFILNANSNVPKLFKNNRKTVGIRIPDNNIARTIVEQLGNPIMTTSIKNEQDNILEYPTDPYDFYERYDKQVDAIIDGGYGSNIASTVVDCTGSEPEILRQGAGELVL